MNKSPRDRKGLVRRSRFFDRALVLLALAMAGATNLHANERLKIVVAGNQTAGRLVKVTVTNAGNVPVTVCMACCGSIIDAKADPVVPDFDVQVQGPRGWSKLSWGCDVGSCFAPSTLAAGEAQEFKLKLAQPGTYLLRLYYTDATDIDAQSPKSGKCPNIAIAKHNKHAISNTFVVSGAAQ